MISSRAKKIVATRDESDPFVPCVTSVLAMMGEQAVADRNDGTRFVIHP